MLEQIVSGVVDTNYIMYSNKTFVNVTYLNQWRFLPEKEALMMVM